MAAPGREAPLQEVVTKHQSRNEIDDHNPNFHQLTVCQRINQVNQINRLIN